MADGREAVAPYKRVADALRQRIIAGEFAPGQQVPSASALASQYEVSRNTAIRALRQLRDDGWVTIEHGWGSFVADNPPAS
jgi:GntR family transcriptional regulator